MGKLTFTLEAKGDSIADKREEYTTELPDGADLGYAANWLVYWLSTELEVENTWLDYLNKLPDPSAVKVSIEAVSMTLSGPNAYYDVMNAAKAWFEIQNQLLAARQHLARSRAYKALEVKYNKNEMHVLHERK